MLSTPVNNEKRESNNSTAFRAVKKKEVQGNRGKGKPVRTSRTSPDQRNNSAKQRRVKSLKPAVRKIEMILPEKSGSMGENTDPPLGKTHYAI